MAAQLCIAQCARWHWPAAGLMALVAAGAQCVATVNVRTHRSACRRSAVRVLRGRSAVRVLRGRSAVRAEAAIPEPTGDGGEGYKTKSSQRGVLCIAQCAQRRRQPSQRADWSCVRDRPLLRWAYGPRVFGPYYGLVASSTRARWRVEACLVRGEARECVPDALTCQHAHSVGPARACALTRVGPA